MLELEKMFNRQLKYMLYLMGIYLLGVVFTSHDSVFQGLLLGTAFSLFIFWSMVKKNKKFAQEVAEGKKTRSLGSLTRMSVAGLAAIIALRYPGEFQVVYVVVGLMTVYFVIMIDYFMQNIRR
ncbi:ATP synthase subunit I [Peribacillus frigoritolerans]|jgi:ATP synthase protein I|uniref:ATP synthase subunit I n=1 Tax=Peribacillus frigoritolerans TaxID=450367 RepID=UPI00209DBD29|nr:ATP synthase subunit I [Peribacillus frigoritolerans]MCP1492438.1 ATP synthase protein I [Peribacillus frigoritolerans]